MIKQEWKRKYSFTNNTLSCANCKHCTYDGDLNISYCEKMYHDTDVVSMVECKVDVYRSSCKVVFER